MSATPSSEFIMEILKRIRDAIVCEKEVHMIKESILTYLSIRSAAFGDSPEQFLAAFKQLVQMMIQIQNVLERDIKPPVEVSLNSPNLCCHNEQNSHQEISSDKHLVQIQAGRKEIYGRISSFYTRKRKEVDDWNVQEFCSHDVVEDDDPIWDDRSSCARVDAIFVPRTGSKSHVKVSRVKNLLGPQIQAHYSTPVILKTSEQSLDAISQSEFDSIEERLRNMESHLKLKSAHDTTARNNIYFRLKQLEDRILYLEGCSPEYLNFLGPKAVSPEKQIKTEESTFYTSSTSKLQKRILSLREELKCKSRKIALESPS